MSAFQKFNSFAEALPEKVHNLGSDTLKVVLSNVAPDAADVNLSDITEISAGFGYSAGGITVTVSSSSQTGGTYSLVISDETLSASGGDIGPFRYATLYNDTASNDELIGFWDRGDSVTLLNGEDLVLDFGATVIQLS